MTSFAALLLPLLLGPGEGPAAAPAPPPFDAAAAQRIAAEALDKERGEASRARYHVVWPDGAPVPPAVGSELVLIGGYISHDLVVVRREKDGFDARLLDAQRSWHYGRGESIRSARLRLDPGPLAERWAAAARLRHARAERTARPAPESESGVSFGIGASHSPVRWFRLDAAPAGRDSWCESPSVTTWDAEGVRSFEQARSSVAHALLHGAVSPAVAAEESWEPLPLAAWLPFLRREIAALADGSRPLDYRSSELFDLCVFALGEAGETADLDLLGAAEGRLRSLVSVTDERLAGLLPAESALHEVSLSRTRILLRCRWDPAFAASVIRGNPRRRHAENDLARRARDLFHQRDPAGYRALLVEDLAGTGDRPLLLETIAEVGARLRPEAPELLGELRGSEDDAIAEAARAATAGRAPRRRRE